MTTGSESLVTLLTASLIHEVHIAKSLLSKHGIESYIFDENITSTIGTAYVEGYKLEVSSSNLDRAKQILAEYQSENE